MISPNPPILGGINVSEKFERGDLNDVDCLSMKQIRTHTVSL
jgi:hypothetical protein